MNDLVECLRFNASAGVPDFSNSKLLDEAADRIEALEAALREIASINDPRHDFELIEPWRIARAALDKDDRK